ncbi:uncharacterized protein EAF01_006544 [Botrytis porri]|uniref:uncharacterized protein n=1 Tax=Botrytis porri TaxID=87229 RepID=UPI001901D3E4|nr:uncharacterized protein EAF01_006544 [Botrytis porri]KAF7903495.1 hypothetical protein EAF01_006544 [Botrytis porri]
MTISSQYALSVAVMVSKFSRGAPELALVLVAAEKNYIFFHRELKMAVTFLENLERKTGSSGGCYPLLANNLVLDRTNDGPGEGCYKHCFLCTEIADNELPWETMAVDW